MTHDELEVYEKMNWETPSDELADAVENLVRQVKRLRLLSMAYESYIAHHVVVEYRQCPECGSLDFTSKFDDEGIECKCDKCDNKWKVKIE